MHIDENILIHLQINIEVPAAARGGASTLLGFTHIAARDL